MSRNGLAESPTETLTGSPEETFALGQQLAQGLEPGTVLCFFGDLAAGKTTLIKGLASSATGCSPDAVSSPTFVYLNIYEGVQTVYHFDLYRLKSAEEFLEMGFDEMLFSEGITCIEWSERITSLLPHHVIPIKIAHRGGDSRHITVGGI